MQLCKPTGDFTGPESKQNCRRQPFNLPETAKNNLDVGCTLCSSKKLILQIKLFFVILLKKQDKSQWF